MADPLSLLRQYHVNRKEITEKNNLICFGEYCWPKTVKTNYLVYGSSRDGPNKEYYTLECLLFLLKNITLQHPAYVKSAAAENIPVVRRPDRKDLLAYLCGETATAASIDKSAPIELPISSSDLHKSEAESGTSSTTILGHSSIHDGDGVTPNKLARLDMQRVREQFAARLDAPKIKKPLPPSLSALSGNAGANSTSIRDAMSNDQIAALKAKRLAKKRSTIIDADSEFDSGQNNAGGTLNAPNVHSVLLQYDSNFTREIQNKERIWRNRSNILQSSGKNFQKSVFPILSSLRSREDGNRKPNPHPIVPQPVVQTPVTQKIATPSTTTQLQQQQTQQQYNRYDQERFTKNDAIGFRIDTTGTYHGLTLKSVTEGSATPKVANPGASQTYPQNSHHAQPHAVNNKPQKRVPRTPIIIIPATTTSLITMYNAKAIFQDLKFIDGKPVHDQRRENEILIQRRKPDNTTVPYRIIDNPLKLNPEDWNRVVAVFVQGPAWQFKGWPWDGNPVEIFARIKAFHIKFDEMKLDPNVAKWAVEIIELSRTKRHLDRANLLKFWSMLDTHIIKHKHNILRY